MDGVRIINNEKANAEESKQCWSNIWDNKKEHESECCMVKGIKSRKDNMKQTDIEILTEMITKQGKKIQHWKIPGPDGVQGYWLKILTALHECIAKQMDDIISNRENIPEWMALGKTVLYQKDSCKGNAVDNYRLISCLPLMWKLMT